MYFTAAGAAILLTAAFVSDLRTMRIPNRLNLAALAAGFLFHAAAGAWTGLHEPGELHGPWALTALRGIGQGVLAACAGAGAGFATMLILYRLGAVGGGDVKLFAALGSWIGAREVFDCAVYAVLAAGAYGLLCLIIGKRRAVRWGMLREQGAGSGTYAAGGGSGAAVADGGFVAETAGSGFGRGAADGRSGAKTGDDGSGAAAADGGSGTRAACAGSGPEAADEDSGGRNAGIGKCRFPFMIAVIPGAIAAWIW